MSNSGSEAEVLVKPKTDTLAAPIASSRALAMRATIDAETEMRALVKEYVGSCMVRDSDYGIIPGTPKPTLLKPGAEKLVELFRCEPHFDVTDRIQDWDRGLFHYEFRCRISERDSGKTLAEGYGSANSREGRYRWRNAERVCPDCGVAAIIKGKEEYGGGFLCFKKKNGCGAKFPDDAPEIVDQQMGKVENDDIFTLVNTILKMAKKRALVDAAIALARCSDLFTQDVEDLGPQEGPALQQRKDERKPRQRPSVPSFGKADFCKKLLWGGGEHWAGKPLMEADLITLTEYRELVSDALEGADEQTARWDALSEHLRDIDAALVIKESPT